MQNLPSEIQALAGRRVLICEDEGITIMQLTRAMAYAGLTVAGIAADGESALELALRERPDIVLMDLGIPGSDCFGIIRRMVDDFHPCVIVLAAHIEESVDAEEAGARASVIKPADTSELLRALRSCAGMFTHAVVRSAEPLGSESPLESPPSPP